MNNTFDWTRFCKVVNKDFRSLWPLFGTTMLILAALPFAIWLFTLVINRDAIISPDSRVVMIIVVSSFAALMLPSRLYRTMNLRNEGIYYAMLPASKLEKYISMLIFTFIVAPVFVYIGSMIIDIILTLLPAGPYHQWLWQGNGGFPLLNTVQDDNPAIFFSGGWVTAVMWTSYFSNPAIFIFAATLFKKHKVLYTLLCLYAIEFILSVVLIPIFAALTRNPNFIEWFHNFMAGVDASVFFERLFALFTAFNVIVAVLFSWLAWHRLKKMPY
jgi:hypothetical protein